MISERHAKEYCSEDIRMIENYENAITDTTQTWCIHHRNEIDMHKSKHELIQLGLYYARPASELIFLSQNEHISLHNTGKRLSDEHKAKISKTTKATYESPEVRAKCASYGFKGKHHSLETIKKLLKPKPKYRWLTTTGEIAIMDKSKAALWHKDWQLLSNIPVDPNEKV